MKLFLLFIASFLTRHAMAFTCNTLQAEAVPYCESLKRVIEGSPCKGALTAMFGAIQPEPLDAQLCDALIQIQEGQNCSDLSPKLSPLCHAIEAGVVKGKCDSLQDNSLFPSPAPLNALCNFGKYVKSAYPLYDSKRLEAIRKRDQGKLMSAIDQASTLLGGDALATSTDSTPTTHISSTLHDPTQNDMSDSKNKQPVTAVRVEPAPTLDGTQETCSATDNSATGPSTLVPDLETYLFEPSILSTIAKYSQITTPALDSLEEISERIASRLYPVLARYDSSKSVVKGRDEFPQFIAELIGEIEKNRRTWLEEAISNKSTVVSAFTPASSKIELPISIRATPQGGIYIDFSSVHVGSGASKRFFLSYDYNRGKKGPFNDLLATSEIKLSKGEKSAEAVEEEFQVQNRLSAKTGVKPFFLDHILKSGAKFLVASQEFFDEGDLTGFGKILNGHNLMPLNPLDEKTADSIRIEIAIQLLQQLAQIHSDGIYHGDIKPGNVLVRKKSSSSPHDVDVEVTLTDFGSYASLEDAEKKLKNPTDDLLTFYRGTPEFAAPELPRSMMDEALKNTKYLKTSEVWALAQTLYYLLPDQNELGCSTGMPTKIALIGNYDMLCKTCKIFCGADDKSEKPKDGTFESIVYQMMNPNPDTRLSIENALTLFTAMKSKAEEETHTASDSATPARVLRLAKNLATEIAPTVQKFKVEHAGDSVRDSLLASYFVGLVNQIEYHKEKWKQKAREEDKIISIFYPGDPQVDLPLEIRVFPDGGIEGDFKKVQIGEGGSKKVYLSFDYNKGVTLVPHPLLAKKKLAFTPKNEKTVKGRISYEYEVQSLLARKAKVLPPRRQYAEDSNYVVSEDYYEEGNLFDFSPTLRGERPLPLGARHKESLEKLRESIGLQLAEQLALIHRQGMLHGDIKPGNVLVRMSGVSGPTASPLEVTLGDFGSSRKVSDQDKIVAKANAITPALPPEKYIRRIFFGTVNYMAPEIPQTALNPQTSTTEHAIANDLWGLGWVLYSLGTGHSDRGCEAIQDGTEFELAKVTSYDGLCKVCGAYCNPDGSKKTLEPAPGSFDHLVYDLLNPDGTRRPQSALVTAAIKVLRAEKEVSQPFQFTFVP